MKIECHGEIWTNDFFNRLFYMPKIPQSQIDSHEFTVIAIRRYFW